MGSIWSQKDKGEGHLDCPLISTVTRKILKDVIYVPTLEGKFLSVEKLTKEMWSHSEISAVFSHEKVTC